MNMKLKFESIYKSARRISMKVGIITLYNSKNYGAFLQGYALQKVVSDMGHDVKFVNFEEDVKFKRPPILLFNIKREHAYKKAYKKMNISNINYLEKQEEFDSIIIGSDEVWNILNTKFKHLPMFFGKNIKANRIATYAVSCGNATIEDLRNNDDCIEGIKNIDYLSGRDKNTVSIMSELSKRKVEHVLDPTLIYDFSGQEQKVNIDKEYILIYAYNFDDEQINHIKKYAKEKNLITVSVGFRHKWCDKMIPAGPFEFLYLVQNSKHVIVNTFHGTLFSIIYRKNFVVFGENKIKINDILKQLELNDRNIEDSKNISKVLAEKIDYSKVDILLKERRKISIEYLKNIFADIEG